MTWADDLFQSLITYYGEFSGDYFNVLRPDYTSSNNTPVTILENVMYRLDPQSAIYSEPKMRDLEFYEIFGDRRVLRPGDLIVPSVDPYGQVPAVTFLHSTPNKAAVGIRTSRICSLIEEDEDDPIYENVYYDFIGLSYPGSSLNKKLEHSLQIPSARVVMFKRPNLFRLKTQLVETDTTATINKDGEAPSTYQRKWSVESIDMTGNLMVLTLAQDFGNVNI